MDTAEQPSNDETKVLVGAAEDAEATESAEATEATEAAEAAEATEATEATEAPEGVDTASDTSPNPAPAEALSSTEADSPCAKPTPTPTSDPAPVCWICYETHADQTVDAPSTLVAPCKCSGSLRTVHQECLLAWMAQTDATACPHCHHTYDVDDRYPSTLQRLCDHPWGPPVVAGLVCGALFYAFHRLWVRMTSKRRFASQAGASGSAMSGSRLLAMMGGGLPAHLLMLPQMGGGRGGLFEGSGHAASGGASLSSGASWNLTGLLAEFEVFALLVMVVYGSVRYVHKWSTAGRHEDEGQRSADASTETRSDDDTLGQFGTSTTTGLDDLWATVDDLWAQSSSGGARLSHEEALYTLPLDILTTLFYVVQHYCKRLQTWGVAKERVVCAWEATQNNLPGSE